MRLEDIEEWSHRGAAESSYRAGCLEPPWNPSPNGEDRESFPVTTPPEREGNGFVYRHKRIESAAGLLVSS